MTPIVTKQKEHFASFLKDFVVKMVTVNASHSFEVWFLYRPHARCVCFCVEKDMDGVGEDRAPGPVSCPWWPASVWVGHVLADISSP